MNSNISKIALKYQLMMGYDDFTRSYYERTRRNIDRALRKKIDKDRYIMNRKALEKALKGSIEKALRDIERGAEGVIEAAATEVLNALFSVGTAKGSVKSSKDGFYARLGNEVAKELGRGIDKFFSSLSEDN